MSSDPFLSIVTLVACVDAPIDRACDDQRRRDAIPSHLARSRRIDAASIGRGGRLAGSGRLGGGGSRLAVAASPSAVAPSARVLSWPIRPRGRRRWPARRRAGAGARARLDHAADQGLAAGQLGDVLDLVGADRRRRRPRPLDLGLLELLDLGRRSPWPARRRRRRPRRPPTGPPGTSTARPSPCRRRRAGPACSSAPGAWIDFLRRSRRSWCSAIASSPFRSRIRTDRLPSRSDLSWSIISSLTYLLMVQLVPGRRSDASRPRSTTASRSRSGRDPDARAHGGRDGDRPDVRPLGGGRLDASAGGSGRR